MLGVVIMSIMLTVVMPSVATLSVVAPIQTLIRLGVAGEWKQLWSGF
jgi:hypothetical protein